MLRNYFLVAIRSLNRHRFFSFINIFGLAISMSVCLGIIMLVADQLMYDRYNTNRDRIYRVVTQYTNADGTPAGNDSATSPQPLGESLTEDYTGVEKAVRIRRGFGNGWIEFEQNVNIPLAGFYADPEALEVFQYELKYGDPETALREPYSVVLTEKAAKKLFRQENPLGEVIKVGNLGEYKVTGVIRDKGQKSHIVFEALASYATVASLEANGTFGREDSEWGNWSAGWVYLLLKEGQSPRGIEQHLAAIGKEHRPARFSADDEHRYKFYLQNISSITPGPFINNAIGPFMPMIFVYFFGGLALIVLLTSCFNYTNLSIARSLTRAREVGVRKVSGAHRHHIFFQFLSEAVILSFLALISSLLLLALVRPFLLSLRFAQVLKWDLEGNVYVYGTFLLFSIAAGFMAGFFPAVALSRFQPVKVLKNAGGLKMLSRIGLRKVLLVVQFTLSLIFIISVLVLSNQLKLFITADYGFDMSQKINVRLNQTNYEALQAELSHHGNIANVSAASHLPAAGTTIGNGFRKSIQDSNSTLLYYFFVDDQYLENLGISLIAGRNFNPAAGASNKNFMLINEQAVKDFHFESPVDAVGAVVFDEGDSSRFEIIGVVKDYNHTMLLSKIEAMALRYDPAHFNILQVRYTGTRAEAVKTIESSWAKVNPSFMLDYRDFKEEIDLFYRTVFGDLVNVIGVISGMAIVISCLGLLGMATYVTETRLKEISIRKVLGSSSAALVLLLSQGFLKLLVLAIMIAIPVAWFINAQWLQRIAYHTEVTAGVIVIAVSILLFLGILTIGSQTLRAAFANPVDALKNE